LTCSKSANAAKKRIFGIDFKTHLDKKYRLKTGVVRLGSILSDSPEDPEDDIGLFSLI
jgi:hypothetical protein